MKKMRPYSKTMPKRLRMCARNNMRQNGGGFGMSYQFGQAVAPGYAEVVSMPSCGGVARPGMIGSIESAAITGRGLIGGGARGRVRHTRSVKRHRSSWNSRTRRGGAYAADFDISSMAGPNPYMPIKAIPCEQRGGAGVAGYTFQPSNFTTSTGAPLALTIPAEGRSCALAGGRRRRSRRSRRSRTNRKH